MESAAHSVGHTGQGELGSKLDNVLLECGELLGRLSARRVGSDKVLEQPSSRLLLGSKSDLNSSVEEVGDSVHVLLSHRSTCQGGQTDTDSSGNLSRGVSRNGVLVDGDVAFVANLFNLGSGQTQRSQVPKDQVVIGSIGLELVVVAGQDLGEGSGVGNDLLGVSLERGVGGLLESNGDTGNGVVVGTSLASRENGLVDPLLEVGFLVLSEEDHTGSGTTQGLVGGGGDYITVVERRALLTGGDETGDVGHVAHEVRLVGVGNLSKPGVVPVSRVSGSTTHDESRLVEVGVGVQLLIVNQVSLGVDSVRERLKVDGRRGNLLLGGVVTMGQVTTIGETETHDSVLRVNERSKGSKVGSRSRVGLDVDTPDLGVQVESLQGTLSAQVFEDVNVLVSSIVSGTRKTLGVLVGEHGAVGLHDGQRGQVLGSNELQTGELPPSLIFDDLGNLWVSLGEGSVEALVKVGRNRDGRSHSDVLSVYWLEGSRKSGSKYRAGSRCNL